jgi:hypothetical protein
MGTLAQRLLNSTRTVVDLESEDIGAVITSAMLTSEETNNLVTTGLNEIQLLGDTVDMLEATASSANGLIQQGVGAEIVTDILSPTIINALAAVDSEVALSATVEFESDEKDDTGVGWFARVKAWVLKIWESIRTTAGKILEWLSGMYSKVFDSASRLNSRAKKLLAEVKSAGDWEISSVQGKAKWSIDLKDPTAQSLNTALYNQKEILLKVKKTAAEDVRLGQQSAANLLKLFDGISRDSMDEEFARKLLSVLDEGRDKRDENIDGTLALFNKGKGNDFGVVGLTAVTNDKVARNDIKFISVKNSDDYTAGNVEILDKANAILALDHIVEITDLMISFKGEYEKAIASAKQMTEKTTASISTFNKSKGSSAAYGSGAIGSHIQTTYTLAFKHMSGDLRRLRDSWSNVVKTPSLQSAANAYDFVETSFHKGSKTIEA